MTGINDMLVVNLQVQGEGGLVVRSCELLHKEFRNRVSFTKLPGVRAVFTAKLAAEVEALVGEFGNARNIVSKPDFAVDLPGLKLGGLTFLVSAVKDGIRSIILRFRYFIGSFQNAFVMDLGWSKATLPHKERIAIESLVDIVGPLYGLALLEERRKLTDGERGEIEQALNELRGNAHALQFYSDLLIRYVRDSATSEAPEMAIRDGASVPRLRLVD